MLVSPELVQVGLLVWAYPGGKMNGLKGVVKAVQPGGPTYYIVLVEVTVENPFVAGQEIKQTLRLNSRQIARRQQ